MLTIPSMSVTSPNMILFGWISGSKGMTFWKFSLALAMAGLNRRLCLSLPPRNVAPDFVCKEPFQLGRECLQFLCHSH